MTVPTITRVDLARLCLPFAAPFRIALGRFTQTDNLFVRIHDDAGRYGIGEGCPASFVTGETIDTAMAAAQLLARLIVSKNPLEIDARLAEMDAFLTHNSAVKCAFDLALYDLLGKHAGLPLYTLWGGQKRVIVSNRTLGIDAPETMAQKAAELKRRGVTQLKVKVGTGLSEDVARIRAIRKAVGGEVVIRADANQGWDAATAIAALTALAPFGVELCEQPTPYWDYAALKRAHDHSPIPIMADESIFDHHDAFRLAALGACDYFNIKLAKSGGLHTALKINAVGASAGIKCMVGGMAETRLAVGAGAHLIAACSNITIADLDSPLHFTEDPITGGVVFHEDGRVELPDAPGHGAEVKEDVWEGAVSVTSNQ